MFTSLGRTLMGRRLKMTFTDASAFWDLLIFHFQCGPTFYASYETWTQEMSPLQGFSEDGGDGPICWTFCLTRLLFHCCWKPRFLWGDFTLEESSNSAGDWMDSALYLSFEEQKGRTTKGSDQVTSPVCQWMTHNFIQPIVKRTFGLRCVWLTSLPIKSDTKPFVANCETSAAVLSPWWNRQPLISNLEVI